MFLVEKGCNSVLCVTKCTYIPLPSFNDVLFIILLPYDKGLKEKELNERVIDKENIENQVIKKVRLRSEPI